MIVDMTRRARLWNLRRLTFVLMGLCIVGVVWSDLQWLRTTILGFHVLLWLMCSSALTGELDRTKPLEVPLRQEVPPTQKRTS